MIELTKEKKDQKSGLKTESGLKSDQKSGLKTSQILDAITANNAITIAMLQEQLNLRNTTLKKMLREMQNVGLIRRVGPDKGGHWEVNE